MRRRDDAVLEALRRGPLTCLQIAGRTGLARATVYSTLSRLLSAGLIERVDEWEERGQRLYRALDVVGRAGGTPRPALRPDTRPRTRGRVRRRCP